MVQAFSPGQVQSIVEEVGRDAPLGEILSAIERKAEESSPDAACVIRLDGCRSAPEGHHPEESGWHAAVEFPAGHPIGSVSVYPRTASHQGPPTWMPVLAQLIAMAYERHRLSAEVRERTRLTALAVRIGRAQSQTLSLQEMLQACTEALVQELGMAFARIWLLDEAGQTLVLAGSAGLSTNLHGAYSRVPVATSLKIGRMVQDRQPRLTNSIQQEAWVKEPDWAKREGLVSYAGYPLVADDRVVGVMAMFARHPLPEQTLQALGGIAGGLAQAIVRNQADQHRRAALQDLGDRVKELQALHQTASLLQRGGPVPQLLSEAVALLPSAWRYPEVAAAKIRFADREYVTPGFRESPWRQSAGFQLSNGQTGSIDVVYLAERPHVFEGPFLAEERRLLESAAEMLRGYLERKQAESALRDSEARYRTLFNSIDEGFCILQVLFDDHEQPIDYRYIETNPGFEHQAGMANALGRTVRELVPGIESFWIEVYGQVARTGQPTRFVAEAKSMGRWFDVYAFRIGDPVDRKVAVLFTDITDRKRIEQDLQGIAWLLQPNIKDEVGGQPYGNLTELNTERLLLESVGKSLLAEVASDYVSLLGTSGAVYERNGDYALSLFTSHWCRFMDRTSRANCQTETNAAAIDSGRWHCHESCWEASRRSIETGQPVDLACKGGIRLYAVPIKADDQIIGSINFGYGDPPRDPQALADVAARYGVTVEELKAASGEYQSRPPYIVELAKQRLHSSAKLLGEIVKRRQAEAALRQSEERLRHFSGRLESLVQERTKELVHSHGRLRKLATELNLAEQRERKRLAAELHDHLQQMLVLCKLKLGQSKRLARDATCAENIQRADDVLAEALTYTRTLVAELSPPVLRDHGLSAGLRWLSDYMRRHEMTVTVSVPDEDGTSLPEDQTVLLFQSVRELLINSWKHAGTGSAHVEMERRADVLRIEVRDAGKGFIVAADDPPVSNPRFGLFSIRERMRALGGSFEIQSAPGKGTQCILEMPLAQRASCASSGPTLLPSSVAGKGELPEKQGPVRVLLVDDHAMVRQGLRSVLEAYPDIEVVAEASNGEEALFAADRLHPAVVVMDINMPKMNGIEATSRIKAMVPGVEVIGLSVNAERDNQDAMLKAGAQTLLTKEGAVDQLYGAILRAIHGERR